MFCPASNAETLPLPRGVTTFGPKGHWSGNSAFLKERPLANAQLVAVNVLLGVIPPLVVATHSVEARLMASLLGFRLKKIQLGMKKIP